MGKAHSDCPLSIRFGKWPDRFVADPAAPTESDLLDYFKATFETERLPGEAARMATKRPTEPSSASASAFLLAVAAALQSGGLAVTVLPVIWAGAASALLYTFLTGSEFIRRHVPFASEERAAIRISAVLFIGILVVNYEIPSVTLYIDNQAPYVIQAQLDGTKWVKVEATRSSTGEAICYAYIDSLQKEGEEKFILIPGEHRRLTADDGGDPGLDNGFRLGGGTSRMFNIANVRADAKDMRIQSKAFNDLVAAPLGPGTYRARIEVSGVNCGPAYMDVTIRYGGALDVSVERARSSWL
jgi:hypothetical protein